MASVSGFHHCGMSVTGVLTVYPDGISLVIRDKLFIAASPMRCRTKFAEIASDCQCLFEPERCDALTSRLLPLSHRSSD